MSNSSFSVDTSINDDAMEMAIEAMFKIYTYPHSAVIREYLANAIDEHVTRGVTEPVEVVWKYLGLRDNNPTYQLSITDHGGGMTPEVLSEVYTQIRLSGKRDDENTTGGFGIGAKVGLAVSDEGFDVITSTGEQAAILRCRHVSQGRIRNDIDVIDAEGIPQGTTVKITFAADSDNVRDMQIMLAAMALASNVIIRTTEHTDLFAPYVIDEGDEFVVYPHGLIEGTHAPATNRHLTTIATARAYRAVRVTQINTDYYNRGHQFADQNIVYLNNTPYPLRYTTQSPSANAMFGVLDIPLEGVSVPRHREAINGVDTKALSDTMLEAHNTVTQSLAAALTDKVLAGFQGFRREIAHANPIMYVRYLMAQTVNPDLTPQEFYNETTSTHLDDTIADNVVAAIIERQTALLDSCDGLVIYSSQTHHRDAMGIHGKHPITRVSDVKQRLVDGYAASYSGPAPAAIICVPDLPTEADLIKTEVSRIRHNIRKAFPATFLIHRQAIIVRSVPEDLNNLMQIKRYAGSSRSIVAPAADDDNGERIVAEPYSGSISWEDLTAKIVRGSASNTRNYVEVTVDPADMSISIDHVEMSTAEVREQLTDGDVLFYTTSRKLNQRSRSGGSYAESVVSSLEDVRGRWFDGTKVAQFLAWHGIERAYIYNEKASAAVRNDITNELMIRLDEMDQLNGEFAAHLDNMAAAEVAQYSSAYTLHFVATTLGISPTSRLISQAMEAYKCVGTDMNYALSDALNSDEEVGKTALSLAFDMTRRQGPLNAVSERVGTRLVNEVIGSDQAYGMAAKMHRQGIRFSICPPDVMEEIAASGGIDAHAETMKELCNDTSHGRYSMFAVNTGSSAFKRAKAFADSTVEDARKMMNSTISLLSGGEVTLEEIEAATLAEHAQWVARKASQEADA